MKLAHIVPSSLLRTIPANQTTHLAISNLIVHDRKYREFYRRKSELGHTVILDNPVHEDGNVDPDVWRVATGLLRPSVAVIPDVIDDPDLTIKNARILCETMKREYPYVKLMAVPHGYSQNEWYHCARALARIPQISYFGISLERRLRDDELALRRRRWRLETIQRGVEFDGIAVHLLGTSERAHEFAYPAAFRRAISTDTSKFAVFHLCGIPVEPPALVATPYPGRGPFGGSNQYLTAKPTLPMFGVKRMRANLANWCTYADSGIYPKRRQNDGN